MQKLGILTSLLIVTGVFIYGMLVLSNNNSCTGVRIFDCQNFSTGQVVTEDIFTKIKPTSDKFLKYCTPKLTDEGDVYIADYSDCNLKVSVNKESTWVQKVLYNGISMSRDEINKNFK